MDGEGIRVNGQLILIYMREREYSPREAMDTRGRDFNILFAYAARIN